MIVLDTSILVDALGMQGDLRAELRALLDLGERVVIPTLVLYEWLRGPRTPEELEAQSVLIPSDQAIPFGPVEAGLAADLYQRVTRPKGREMDLAIAACAISWNARLWAMNRRDFADIPGLLLTVPVNPMDGGYAGQGTG